MPSRKARVAMSSIDETQRPLLAIKWPCLLFCRNHARLEELNQQWQAPDPAAYVRDALIASGMTTTRDVRVLGVSDADMASIRCVVISYMATMLLDIK